MHLPLPSDHKLSQCKMMTFNHNDTTTLFWQIREPSATAEKLQISISLVSVA